jgi:hypothetical protein
MSDQVYYLDKWIDGMTNQRLFLVEGEATYLIARKAFGKE